MTSPTVMRIMSLSINTAKKAGTIIRDVMQKGVLGIVEKGKDDLQTEADRSAQRCIIASLSKQFPSVNIIGEEGKSDLNVPKEWLVSEGDEEFLKNTCPEHLLNVKDEDCVIWVDPLDGTSEYTQGFLERVTVLIGVAVKSRPVGGVIHQPYYKHPTGELGRTLWGVIGIGTGGFEPIAAPEGKLIITTTRTHSDPIVLSAVDVFKPTEVLKVGGAGYKVLQLLQGKAHAYVFASKGCKKWDTCAPEAVLEAAGGTLTDMYGEHYSYNSEVEYPNNRGVLATIGKLSHEDFVNRIPQQVRDSLKK